MLYWDCFTVEMETPKFLLLYFNSNIPQKHQKARMFCRELIASTPTHMFTCTHILGVRSQLLAVSHYSLGQHHRIHRENLGSPVHHTSKSIDEFCHVRKPVLKEINNLLIIFSITLIII